MFTFIAGDKLGSGNLQLHPRSLFLPHLSSQIHVFQTAQNSSSCRKNILLEVAEITFNLIYVVPAF